MRKDVAKDILNHVNGIKAMVDVNEAWTDVELGNDHDYQCAGCIHVWNDTNCVKEHLIKSMRVYFCLNCDDWINEKAAVFNQGWTMFDEAGFLRHDI